MENVRPRRSVLFVPGSNARALEKARGLDCDVVALDLEDAVAPSAKGRARSAVGAHLAAHSFGNKEVAVRINAQSSTWGAADLTMVVAAHPDAIILPKVAGPTEIRAARNNIPHSIALWAMIETPGAVLAAPTIAAAGAACLILGSNDLMKDLRALLMPGRENLWTAMGLIVLAARAQGIAVIDGSHNALDDNAGLLETCRQGRAFGFDGKTLIHPNQIATANRVFAPDANEISTARSILAAFAEAPDKSVLTLNGRMMEKLHADEAARLVALAEAIEGRC